MSTTNRNNSHKQQTLELTGAGPDLKRKLMRYTISERLTLASPLTLALHKGEGAGADLKRKFIK